MFSHRDGGKHDHETMERGAPGGRKKRAAARLEDRVHSGKHSERGKCGCALWDPTRGYRRPGSTSGRK